MLVKKITKTSHSLFLKKKRKLLNIALKNIYYFNNISHSHSKYIEKKGLH